MISILNGELSNPLCDSQKRGLTLVRLEFPLPKDTLCKMFGKNWHSDSGEVNRKNVKSLQKDKQPTNRLLSDNSD